jgi:hypothetical protein
MSRLYKDINANSLSTDSFTIGNNSGFELTEIKLRAQSDIGETTLRSISNTTSQTISFTPDVGDCSAVLTKGTHIILGTLTFRASSLKIQPSEASTTYTYTYTAPTSNTVISVPDPIVPSVKLSLINTTSPNVTQLGGNGDPVSVSGTAGKITMSALMPLGSQVDIDVANPSITATSNILVWASDTINVVLNSQVAGSMNITVSNYDQDYNTPTPPIIYYLIQ